MTPTVHSAAATPAAPAVRLSPGAQVLAACRAEGRAALVGYLPVGFPTVQTSIEAMVAMARAGADIIEVGVPYSCLLYTSPSPRD